MVGDGWETHTLWIPSDVFPVAVDGVFATTVHLADDSDQPDGVLPPPTGWKPTHVVAAVADGADVDWWELWTGDPDRGGRRIGGRHLPEAGDIAIPIHCFKHLRVVVHAPAPTTFVLLLARQSPTP